MSTLSATMLYPYPIFIGVKNQRVKGITDVKLSGLMIL